MLIMVVLLGLGMSGLFLTKSNVQMLTNTNLRNQALYVAEAGLERARDILNGPVAPDLTALLGGAGHVANPADEIPQALDSVYGLPVGRGAILTDTAGVPLVECQLPHQRCPRRGGSRQSSRHAQFADGHLHRLHPQRHRGMPHGQVHRRRRGGGRQPNRGHSLRGNGQRRPHQRGAGDDHGRRGDKRRAQGAGGIAAVLCNSGKNSCDDNNSVQNNVVVNN
jgi:hypothetical protein